MVIATKEKENGREEMDSGDEYEERFPSLKIRSTPGAKNSKVKDSKSSLRGRKTWQGSSPGTDFCKDAEKIA